MVVSDIDQQNRASAISTEATTTPPPSPNAAIERNGVDEGAEDEEAPQYFCANNVNAVKLFRETTV